MDTRVIPVFAALLALFAVACESLPDDVEHEPTVVISDRPGAELSTPAAGSPDVPADSEDRPASTRTPAFRRATITPAPPTAVPDVDWDALVARLAAGEEAVGAPDEALAGDLETAVLGLLAGIDDLATEDGEAAVARLTGELSPAVTDGSGAVRTADLTGDRRPDLLVAPPAPGLPFLVFRAGRAGWEPHRLPLGWPDPDVGPPGEPRLEAVSDVNGAGSPDVLYSVHGSGASASYVNLRVAVWDGAAFRDVFDTVVDDWAGPAPADELYEIASANGGVELRTRCAAFGAFDHKLSTHPTLERTYTWDAERGRFMLAASTLDAPVSQRQQANVAEAALRRGDLEAAATDYALVTSAGLPNEEEGEVEWSSFADYRLGVVHALAGRPSQAAIALANAAAAEGTVADLAGRFMAAYGDGDTAAALAAVQRTDSGPGLYGLYVEEQAEGLGFPLTARDVLWPGLAPAAWLAANGAAALGDDPADTLADALDIPVAGALAEDLDDDGRTEVVVLLEEPLPDGDDTPLATIWLLDVQGGRTVPHLVLEGWFELGPAVDLFGGRRGVALRWADGGDVVLGWTGEAVTLHDPEPPHGLRGYQPGFDPRPGHEPCVVR